MLVSLSLGAISVGIYIARFNATREKNMRNAPKNHGSFAKWSVVAVTMIMLTSLLVGLLACGIYYGVTYKPKELTCADMSDALKGKCCPTCEKCIWGPSDEKSWNQAQETVGSLREKANIIPRHLQVMADCDATAGCTGGACCGIKTGNLTPAAYHTVRVQTPAQPHVPQQRPQPGIGLQQNTPVPLANRAAVDPFGFGPN